MHKAIKPWFLFIICSIVTLTLIHLWMNILILEDKHPKVPDILYDASFIYNESDNNTQKNPFYTQPAQQASLPDSENIPKKGYYIHINLDELTMYIYKDNTFIKSYPISGGAPDTPSPVGTWRIISKDTWGEGFGGAWLGFNVPWGEYGIHGTIYPWFIGKSNSSKGCIRMLNKDVKELYNMIPYGTTVTVIQNKPVFRMLKNGDIGSDVLEVQRALKKLGYYYGSNDGVFGDVLKSGVAKFQKENRLYVTGIINRQTYNLIIEKSKSLEAGSH